MITLDGRKLSEFGFMVQSGQGNPATPNMENKVINIPAREGLYYFGTEVSERPLTIPLAIIEKDKIELQRKVRDLVAFLCNNYGRPRKIQMVYDYEPDKFYLAYLSSPINIDRAFYTGALVLNFSAYDPYAYSLIYADELNWGNERINFGSSYLLGREGSDGLIDVTEPTKLNLYVDGLAVKPTIEINGSAKDLVISTNGYVISVGTFTTAEWVIDCEKYTVIKDDVSTFLTGLRDFILMPGSNEVKVAGTNMDISIRIKFRDKYI